MHDCVERVAQSDEGEDKMCFVLAVDQMNNFLAEFG